MLRPGSMNGFNYVEGNPINRVDPSGYQVICQPDVALAELSALYGIQLKSGASQFFGDEICVIHDTIVDYAGLLGGSNTFRRNVALTTILSDWILNATEFNASYWAGTITLPPHWLHDALLMEPDGNSWIVVLHPCFEDKFYLPPDSLPTNEIEAQFTLAHEIGHGFVDRNPYAFQSFKNTLFSRGGVLEGMGILANSLVMRNAGREKDEIFADALAAKLYAPSLLHERMINWIAYSMPIILK